MTISLNRSYRTKLKVAAIMRESNIQETFDYALDLLFDEYEGVIKGNDETYITLPVLATSQNKVNIVIEVDQDKIDKLEILSRKTGFSKSVFCNVAIYLLLQEMDL